LATFNGYVPGNGDGLIMDAAGDLFGTTSSGGTYNAGTFFEITANTHVFSTLWNFTGHGDGSNPECTLIMDSQGDLYGTTEYGGVNDFGTVFEISAVPEPGFASLLVLFYAYGTTRRRRAGVAASPKMMVA
jgi:uncharacterized repeat protein (TIGR03803 family)